LDHSQSATRYAVRDTPDFNRFGADMTALGRVGLPDDIGPMMSPPVAPSLPLDCSHRA
jgi:hypothetical protein